MGRVFYNTQYSDYLGENRAILDIVVRNVPDVPSPTPSVTPSPTPTPSITPTRTVTPTVTPTGTVTPTVTSTPTVTPTITPSVTNNPICPEQFIITNSTDPNNADGTYNRKYSYSGGSMTYGYYKDGIGYVGTAPDGFNYPVFKATDSNRFVFRRFNTINVDSGWCTSLLAGDPWSSSGVGGIITPGYYNTITQGDVRWLQGGTNTNGSRSFYLTYTAVCPTTTPTMTPTQTKTPTNTPTPSTSPPPPPDPDAINYLNAVVSAGGIVDATISGATDTLYKTLKSIGVYSKLKAFYPIIGGTQLSHAVEGKSPGGTYDLTFYGSWIHTVKGMQTTAYSDSNYADTHYIPTDLNPNSNHMFGYYNKRGSSGPNTYDGAGPSPYFILGHPVVEFFSSSAIVTAVGDFTNYGSALGTRQASNITKVFRSFDGDAWVQGSTTNTTAPTTYPSNSITISKINAVGFSSNERYAFLSFGDGLSDTEGTDYYNAVLAFQTTLGRNTNS